jgi:methyltransferase
VRFFTATSLVIPSILFLVAFVPMLLEARRSRANERGLRLAGAVEPRGDVYKAMQVLYPACFVAMIVESWIDPPAVDGRTTVGAGVLLAAKALKYSAIATLGPRWTFRVLVPPGSPRSVAGPYRFMRHPNYVAVAGELAGVALIADARIVGPIALIVFGSLMLMRVRVEEAALRGQSARRHV